MKKLIIIAAIFLAGTSLFADEIHLSDGGIIKGSVIQITDTGVEYDPEGARVFDVIDKKTVVKIKYDNGTVANFKVDTLHRADGTDIRGTVIRVTKDEIVYTPEGSVEQISVARAEIERIDYSDGTSVDIPGDREHKEDAEVFEEKKQSGGFIDSWIRVAGFMAFGSSAGGIFEREQRVLEAYRADLLKAYVFPRDYRMYNTYGSGGGELDLLLPAVKFTQKRSFDLSGIKFGIRGRYGYEVTESTIYDGSTYYSFDDYEMFHGELMSYHYWAAGPVMNLVFSPRSNVFNLLLNFYAVGGQVFNGTVRGAAALRSARYLAWEMLGAAGPYGTPPFLPASIANITNTSRFNTVHFNGYTVRIGFGPHFSLNKYAPITFGVNVIYAYTNIKLGRALPIYFDGNRRATHHEAGGEISVGFHIL
ncbi:MAG TPA: hypothetical protein PK307_01945 [Spirochaetota bacterium]|nr:hypothetical protein [Spirochaetota bacterium]HOD13126.1 hypothetical protein [Spirochaetota bacterium]HQL80937.1 hypothetical protein [Spirochaetota bacterium]